MKFHIYGAGLYGLTLGRVLTDKGHEVVIFEKEDHIGGMAHTHRRCGIEIHEHGAHLFHTDNDRVIEFVKRFSNWTPYIHKVKARVRVLGKDKLISLPLSYQSIADFYDLNDREDKEEVCKYILNATSRKRHPIKEIDDLIQRIGWDLYEYVIKPYSEKQWGCSFELINPSVIERIGMTQDFNTNYFKDRFQALPEGGYDKFLERLSRGLDIHLNSVFNYDPEVITVYTGAVDDLLERNVLPYRSLTWDTMCSDYIPDELPVINTPQHPISTRIIYHNNFINNQDVRTDRTIMSIEYPQEWKPGLNRYYPVLNDATKISYDEAVAELKQMYPNLVLGGRLGLYKYLDMDDTILEALKFSDRYE